MTRDDALDQLPPTYAEYLRCRDAGVDDQTIADRLDMPLEAIPSFASIAEAKLARLLAPSKPAELEGADGR